jgi:IS1 family transposase
MKSILAYARIFPPEASQGWTINFLERRSRYWLVAVAGKKDAALFAKATTQAWQWAKDSQFVCWFTDGERRYAQQLWKIASCCLKASEFSRAYGYRKVWRQGLEVAIKIKGSQGNKGVKWLKPEHPYTAISPVSEVHANHNEAHNSALRRRCSAYRRRQNHYAKNVEGLQRALSVQRLVHNWIKPHWGLSKQTTPAMAMGLFHRPVKMEELLFWKGFLPTTP